ncbi:transmembrane sensor [Pedobacter africanus]|uniref:Ferric-dicitrate binding protein FerR (Iron transport regulator) n=1 Tax=Pedobacter africanus TaxID=151894 RepID=A0ACC6KU91_9SPHI|nr:FecR domain-containing protein [Pedobacter africanus]MDR6782904.1 ferric-dicitrate binding protein FerR (iron transport regulator) [Pedobacter africanus]
MDNSKAKAILEKYKSGTLNQAEQHLLEDWYLGLSYSNKLDLEEGELDQNLEEIWKTISSNTAVPMQKTYKIVWWKKLGAAAAVLLVFGAGFYFYNQKESKTSRPQSSFTTAVQPGSNRATLTLANGKVIALDDAGSGKLAEQAGVSITKTKDGQLVYTIANGAAGSNKETINTITTPKGGQYQVNLPDGSRVWLNAASSLRYPVYFTGAERRVTLTGEAYFEIAKVYSAALSQRGNAPQRRVQAPFIVLTDKQQVTVLGTHFNINAYTDEPVVKTTLLEGAVRVNRTAAPATALVLKPGEQSSIAGSQLNVVAVNTEEAIAWKNGMFMFKDADLKTVMRAIARWYDVEVQYEGTLPDKEFSGDIYRNLDLNQVLSVLSFYKVHFRVEGKKITVTP